MRSMSWKGGTALAALALTATACQSAVGNESTEDSSTPWKVSHAGPLDASMTSVAAVSKTEGWAISSSVDDQRGQDELLHRTGGEWEKSTLPDGVGADDDLLDVEGSDPENVWLLGQHAEDDGESFAYRWDGSGWSSVPAPPGEPRIGGGGFTVAGPDEAWAIGSEKQMYRWNGERWSTTQLPSRASDVGVGETGEVWAVGMQDAEEDEGQGLINQPAAMRWDGERWQQTKVPEYRFPEQPPEETASLDTVVAVSEKEVYAVGRHTFNHGEVDEEPEAENILLRWNGSEWKKSSAKTAEKASKYAASDGDGGLVMGNYHWKPAKSLQKIAKHKPVPGRTGEVTEEDKKQKHYPEQVVNVPGTQKVWSAGVIELGASGDDNFRRPSVLEYDAGS